MHTKIRRTKSFSVWRVENATRMLNEANTNVKKYLTDNGGF